MFGEELHESCVGLAIVRFGAKIDHELARSELYDFLLRRAWFDGNLVDRHIIRRRLRNGVS